MCLSERCNEFLVAVGAGLAVEGLEVVLDGVGRQVQAPRDLLDGMTLEEKVQDVELAGGELVPGRQGGQQLIGGSRLHYDSHVVAVERAGRQAEPAP